MYVYVYLKAIYKHSTANCLLYQKLSSGINMYLLGLLMLSQKKNKKDIYLFIIIIVLVLIFSWFKYNKYKFPVSVYFNNGPPPPPPSSLLSEPPSPLPVSVRV